MNVPSHFMSLYLGQFTTQLPRYVIGYQIPDRRALLGHPNPRLDASNEARLTRFQSVQPRITVCCYKVVVSIKALESFEVRDRI